MKNPPCFNCKERHAYCHVTCEFYLDYCRDNEDARKERERERNVDNYFGERKVKVARCFTKKDSKLG